MLLVSSTLNSFIQLVGVLLIFIFVLVITYFVTRWIGGYQKTQMVGHKTQVMDTVRIANNKYVQILQTGNVYLVIAVGKDEVTMLAKLTEEEVGSFLEGTDITKGGGTADFKDLLDKFKDRFAGNGKKDDEV